MITPTPLPRLLDLGAACLGAPPTGPARFWQGPQDQAIWFGKGSWALRAVADALTHRLGRPPRIMVPQFFCWQALWPLRQSPARLMFYPVDENGQAGPLPDQPADLVLALHLFGRPHPLQTLRAWCDQRSCLLLEDAAHALAPAPGIGTDGDLVLYSPHKTLAVPDGSVLVIRPGAHDLVDAILTAQNALGGGPLPTRTWILKRLVQASPMGRLAAALRKTGPTDFMADPDDAPLPLWNKPSPLSLALLSRMDLPAAAQQRRLNAVALSTAIKALAPWQPFMPYQDHTPYRVVFRCADSQTASTVFTRLRSHGLPVESWPDLPPAIKGGDSMAWRLRQSLICLPCHQSLSADRLANAYRSALEPSCP